MANVAVLNDHPMVLQALATPLIEGRHQVLGELSPVDWERVITFAPDVVVAGLSRTRGHAGSPIEDPEADLAGYQALVDMKAYPAILAVPVVLVGIGVDEAEIPLELNYDLFLYFPDEMERYQPVVAELATEKRKRKISAYVCPFPGCRSRLLYHKEPAKDLYCPKCGTSVAIVDKQHALWMDPEAGEHRCLVADLRTPGQGMD